VTAVGVDVFIVGAAMQCYKDVSTSYASHVCIHFIIPSFIVNPLKCSGARLKRHSTRVSECQKLKCRLDLYGKV